jgi:hypothetical protein
MRLRNKKTGEIRDLTVFSEKFYLEEEFGKGESIKYNTLAELNKEWEDYEEPKKGTYFINTQGDVQFWDSSSFAYPDDWTKEKLIGNYFETKEEAEKAVEKLEAWKRLKDHNLRIERGQRVFVNADNKLTSQKPLFVVDTYEEVEEDLDLLFGGEE